MIDFNTQVLGWDLETQGSLPEYALQPWRAREGKAWVSASAYTRGEASQGQLYPSTASIKAVLERAVAQNLYVCGWNVTFDVAWLCALGLQDLAFQVKWLDSMLLWRHLDVEPEGDDIPHNKRRSYKLETAMHEFFPDEAGFKEFTNFQTRDPEELQLLLFRCKEDTRFAVRLGEMFWHLLSAKQQQVALIEARCIPQVALANVNGIWSSREHAEALQVRLETDGAAVKEQLLSMCPDLEIVESGLKPKELKALQEQHPSSHFINLGSPLQLATLLFDIWGLPCLKQTKGTDKNPEGNRSTDKYVLYELAFQDPRAKMLKEVRECKNNCTKYAVATQKCLDYNGDGYIRPQARVFSTYSSRMTYSSDQSRKGDKELKTKKETFQIGVALHQWKRGKEFRRLIRVPQTFDIWSQPSDLVQESGVPAGYDMLELDFAGQEFRWMAVASRDETMLSLCAPGEDAHSYMGAQIAQMDYHELIRLVKAGDEKAGYQRKLGKFCIAEGEMVLTDQGLVKIEEVSLDMRVWDGVEFVAHTGSVYQGEKEVITYAGLTATLDHMVYLRDGSSCYFGEAAIKACDLARTGDGGQRVRIHENKFATHPERGQSPEGRMSMSEMRQHFMGKQRQPKIWEGFAVQGVRNPSEAYQRGTCNHQRSCDGSSTEEMQCNETAVREPKRSVLQELRRAWDSLQIWLGGGSYRVYIKRAATPVVSESGHRPQGEQRPLRARESTTHHKSGEFTEQAHQPLSELQRDIDTQATCVSCTTHTPPRSDVLTSHSIRAGLQRVEHGGDSNQVEPPKLQTKRVYDITNAGSRHRYTVSNYLVSNSNLSFQYRVGPKTALQKARTDYEMDLDETFIKQILATYKATFPGIAGQPGQTGYWTQAIYRAKMAGYAETVAGRRVQLKGTWSGRDAWPMESTAINYPIQGTGADQKYLALAVGRNMLPKYNAYFYYELHDGLFLIAPKDRSHKFGEVMLHTLSNLPYKQAWGVDLPIQLPVDCKISGESWGDLKNL